MFKLKRELRAVRSKKKETEMILKNKIKQMFDSKAKRQKLK